MAIDVSVQRNSGPVYYTVAPLLLPSGNLIKCHEEVLYICSLLSHQNVLTFSPLTGDAQKRSRCVQIFLQTTLFLFLEKNLKASRPSEQPPVREKNVITFR